MKKSKAPIAPRSCSARRGVKKANVVPERSKSPFRAMVPADELLSVIESKLAEARRHKTQYATAHLYPLSFSIYEGRESALAELQKTVIRLCDEQALARNDKSSNPPSK